MYILDVSFRGRSSKSCRIDLHVWFSIGLYGGWPSCQPPYISGLHFSRPETRTRDTLVCGPVRLQWGRQWNPGPLGHRADPPPPGHSRVAVWTTRRRAMGQDLVHFQLPVFFHVSNQVQPAAVRFISPDTARQTSGVVPITNPNYSRRFDSKLAKSGPNREHHVKTFGSDRWLEFRPPIGAQLFAHPLTRTIHNTPS